MTSGPASLTFHAVAMYCALAAPVFAAAPGRGRWSPVAAVAIGLVASSTAFRFGRPPDFVWVALFTALVAVAQLVRPVAAAAGAGGVLGGIWASLLHTAGLPWMVVVPVAAAPSMLSAFLAVRRPRFAPAVVREEALLVVLVVGLAVAMVPSVQEGWRSAVVLNIQDQNMNGHMIPGWAFGLTGASLALGGLYSLWRRG